MITRIKVYLRKKKHQKDIHNLNVKYENYEISETLYNERYKELKSRLAEDNDILGSKDK